MDKESVQPITGAQLRELIVDTVLAPSGHNTQPWKFDAHNGIIDIYADYERHLAVADPDGRELIISLGCALANLEVAAAHAGFAASAQFFAKEEEPNLVIRCTLKRTSEPDKALAALYPFIDLRHTQRSSYQPQEIPKEYLEALRAACEDADVRMLIVTDQDRKEEVGRLQAEAQRRLWADPAYRTELAAWVRPNWITVGDGLPGYAVGQGLFASIIAPAALKFMNLGETEGEKDLSMISGSPALVVFHSDTDDRLSWVATGRSCEFVLLEATRLGIRFAWLNQVIEVPELRNRLREELGIKGYPQLALRLGFARPGRPTPRRLIDDVLV